MFLNNQTAVFTCALKLVWDSVSKPETNDDGGKSLSLTLAIPKNAPEVEELRKVAEDAIREKFPTGRPKKFEEYFKEFDEEKYPELAGTHWQIRPNTQKHIDTYNGKAPISHEEFGRLVYAGAEIKVVVSGKAYVGGEYNKHKHGAGFWLNGAQIVNLDAPKLSCAGGMTSSQIANVFGADVSAASVFTETPAASPTPAATPVAQPPVPTAPAAPNPGIVPPVPTPKLAGIGQTVESMQAAGWTVEQLRAEGYVM